MSNLLIAEHLPHDVIDWLNTLQTKDINELFHWIRVGSCFLSDPDICKVALLHDIVEDGYATLDEVAERFGLSHVQSMALEAITRRPGEQYFNYIDRVGKNKMARMIKKVDLQSNMKRCLAILSYEPERCSLIIRYAKAYQRLSKEDKK